MNQEMESEISLIYDKKISSRSAFMFYHKPFMVILTLESATLFCEAEIRM